MKKEIGFSSQSCSPALHNLISIEELSSGQIESLLNNAQAYAAADFGKAVGAPYLGQTQINLFFENSTRTRSSFEIAGQRLGLDIVNIDVAHSSIKKGESLSDTAINLNAMQPSIVVVRHNQSGTAKFLTSYFDCPLINAGDGAHEHPTQALLDALTIRQGKGRLKGLTIAICGDILHSRVARSNLFCLGLLGARLRFIAPSTLLPTYLAQTGVEVFHSMEEGLKNVDVIMMLRLQNERMDGAFFPSPREYYHFFSLNEKRLQIAKPDCLVLHPGPINRGVEIASSVVDGAHSLIRKQVENGVAIRMAVLATLLEANKKKLHPGKRKKA